MKDDDLINEMLKLGLNNEIGAGYPVLTEDHFFFQQEDKRRSSKAIRHRQKAIQTSGCIYTDAKYGFKNGRGAWVAEQRH